MHSLAPLVLAAATSAAAQAAGPYWMEAIDHAGLAPFNPDRSYTVFRNVKDFGAKGDGGESRLPPAVPGCM